MIWYWFLDYSEKLSEQDFFELLDTGLCSQFVEFLEIYEGKGYYIPFVTTSGYLSHTSSRNLLKLDVPKKTSIN